MPYNKLDKIKFLKKKIRDDQAEISALKRKNTALSAERDYFRQIFDGAKDGLIVHDEQGRILEVNSVYCRRLGYTRSEMLNMSLQKLVPQKFARLISRRLELLRRSESVVFESQDLRKDGTVMPVEVNATLANFSGRKLIQSVVRDIQDRKTAEELIHATMEDNARLLKELQRQASHTSEIFLRILNALSEKAGKGTRDSALNMALRRHKIRVSTLAFIQNMLAQASPSDRTDLGQQMRRLIPFIFSQFELHPCRILSHFEAEVVPLPRDRASLCCLLIAELYSNALLHAFPKRRPGEVHVQLGQEPAGGYVLSVADTGVGLPKGFRLKESATLGMQIILDLVGALQGAILLYRRGGTRFVVRFK